MSRISNILLLLLVSFGLSHAAPFSLASYYTNNMMLQRAPASAIIWGFADSLDSTISTTLFGNTFTTKPEQVSWASRFVWTLKLSPVASNNVPVSIVLTETQPDTSVNTVTLNNVLFGDIWFCSGQSNMEFPMLIDFNATDELNNLFRYDKMRLLNINLDSRNTPQYDVVRYKHLWTEPNRQLMENWGTSFSATCWFFGKQLNIDTNVPIGLIASAWGGTNIEKWISQPALRSCNTENNMQFSGDDSFLWNAMVHPFFKMPITGAVWYQGESNTGYNRGLYDCIQAKMIQDWRDNWYAGTGGSTNPMFPFGFVQLANADAETESVGGYPVIRWAQTYNYGYAPNPNLVNVFMATAVDLVDNGPDPIHPRYKRQVGERLALGARALAYGDSSAEYLPPIVDDVEVFYGNRTVTVAFKTQFSPLSITVKNKNGFEVCCNNAQCPIDNRNQWEAVTDFTVSGSELSFNLPDNCIQLRQLRYLWRQKPCEYMQCALYAPRSDLPIYPFLFIFPV